MISVAPSFIRITSDGGQVGRIVWANALGRSPGRVRWVAGWYVPLRSLHISPDLLARWRAAADAFGQPPPRES
jgi:hypothetical protein